MHTSARLALLIVAAGASTAFGQDSVSRNANGGNGLPGDAFSAWAFGAAQRSSYIVDLAPFTTSAGTTFGIAPIMKSGKAGTARFTALNGSSAVSAATRLGAPHPSTSYTLWTAAGGGVNTAENDAALNSTVTPVGTVSVLGVGFMDFEDIVVGTTNVLTNQLYAGLVAFNPSEPARLYVTRINAAANSSSGGLDRSQFGFGAIDADGNLTFRADSFGSTGAAAQLLVGDNYFRVRSPARSNAVNVIDNNGATNAASTDWVLVRNTVTHASPTAVPADLAGRSIVLGADFIGQYRYESSPLTTSTTAAHRPGTTDHRGGATFSAAQLFSGSVGTAAILSRTPAGASKTDSLSIWGVDSAGAVTTARTFTLPTSLVDQCNAFSWSLNGGDFRGYDSQVTFRGGSSSVAVGQDQAGRALVAAVVYNGLNPVANSPYNAIAAARFDPAVPTSTPTWTAAAWVNTTGATGKELIGDYGLDGVDGTDDAGEGDGIVNVSDAPIGRLASLSETALGMTGPSMSAPAFDAAGNIYFIASVQLKTRVGQQIVNVFEIALVRGIYDPQVFCYDLEVVAKIGDIIQGPNSGTPYRIQSLFLADGDSISSSSLWPGSATQQPWNRINHSELAPSSPQNLGGLALSARIAYDRNGDGVFEDPSLIGGNTASIDEAYNVVLYIANITQPSNCGSADFDGDGDTGTDADIEAFFACLGGNCCPTCGSADFDGDGDTGTDADIEAFFRVLGGGVC